MAQRNSVSLHDIVFADLTAQNYYKSQKSLGDTSVISDISDIYSAEKDAASKEKARAALNRWPAPAPAPASTRGRSPSPAKRTSRSSSGSEGKSRSRDRVPGPSRVKRIALTDTPFDIDCDPLALADYLLLIEEESNDINELAPTLPNASLLSDTNTTSLNGSTTAVVQKQQSVVSTLSAQRKQSAIDEHERIRQTLNACGFLLEL